MVEKKWLAVTAQPFTADGTQFGIVTVADTAGLKTKQNVFISANTLPILNAQVKRVISKTQLIVGPINNRVDTSDFFNISAYTVALSSSIAAAEQDRAVQIPDKDHYQAIYESDPIVADRVVLVDQYGNLYNSTNPLPINFTGSISIGSVTIKDSDGDELDINPDGSVNAVVGGVNTPVISNFITINASTEYNYSFPANTKKFSLNARGNAKLQFSYTIGQSGSNFKTVFPGNSYSESNIVVPILTIYFQSNKAGEVVEILSWS